MVKAEYVKDGKEGETCAVNIDLAAADAKNVAPLLALGGYVHQLDFSTPQQGYALNLDSTKGDTVLEGALAGLQAAGAMVVAAATLLAF